MNSPIAAYTADKIKKLTGRNGPGYEAQILRNGKKVADVAEYADGGPVRIDWVSADAAVEFQKAVAQLPNPDGYGIEGRIDVTIEEIVDEQLALARLASALKKTIFIRESNGKIAAYSTKKNTAFATMDGLRPLVLAKHPGCTVLNNLPLPELFAILRADRRI